MSFRYIDITEIPYPHASISSLPCDDSFKSLPWISYETLYNVPSGFTYSEVSLLPVPLINAIERDYLDFIMGESSFRSLRNKFKKLLNADIEQSVISQITPDVIHLWRTCKRIEYKKAKLYYGNSIPYNIKLYGIPPLNHLELIYSILPDYDKIALVLYRHSINLKSRKARTKKFITRMFHSYSSDILFFVTLTFTDHFFDTCSPDTRKLYAERWLKDNTLCYYANIDYGALNQREHFHAVVALRPDFIEWPYGFYDLKHCRITDNDVGRLATYINKLTNHANKVTSGKCFHSKENK